MNEEKGRIRKTISFKKHIFNRLDDDRGKKPFATHLNDFLEEKLGLKKARK